MRLAIVNLTGGAFSGGYRKYLANMLPRLAQDARVTALEVFVPPAAVAAFVGAPTRVQSWSEGDARDRFRGLRRRLAAIAPDVVFIPTARYLDVGLTPVLVMVRNMEPLLVPFGGNPWTEGIKNVARSFEARRAARRATR